MNDYIICNKNPTGRWWGDGEWWNTFGEMFGYLAKQDKYRTHQWYIQCPYYMADSTPSIWCQVDPPTSMGRARESWLPDSYTYEEMLNIIKLYAPLL